MRVLLKMSLEGLPPSVNEMYGISKRRKYKSSEVDKWQWKTVTDFKKNYRAETYTGDAEIKITLQKALGYRQPCEGFTRLFTICRSDRK